MSELTVEDVEIRAIVDGVCDVEPENVTFNLGDKNLTVEQWVELSKDDRELCDIVLIDNPVEQTNWDTTDIEAMVYVRKTKEEYSVRC